MLLTGISMGITSLQLDYKGVAERVGFEPTIPVKVCPLSRRIVSTTHAPLRVGQLFSCGVLRANPALRISAAGSRFAHARKTPQLSRRIPRQARDFNPPFRVGKTRADSSLRS